MAVDPLEFGHYLRGLRKARGLTLVDLNKASGVSQPYLSQIENGKAGGVPSPDILKKIAEPLGVQYSHLMYEAGYWDWMNDEDADPLYAEHKDLGFVMHQDKILYGEHELTEKDKKLIILYLEALFLDRQ